MNRTVFYDLNRLEEARASNNNISEDQEQAWLFQWAARHPDERLRLMYAIPNGGWRGYAQGTLLKLTGVKPGVPDIHLPIASGGHNGLYIEMKKLKDSYPSKEQKKWLERLKEHGHQTAVCKGFEQARDLIIEYLGVNQ